MNVLLWHTSEPKKDLYICLRIHCPAMCIIFLDCDPTLCTFNLVVYLKICPLCSVACCGLLRILSLYCVNYWVSLFLLLCWNVGVLSTDTQPVIVFACVYKYCKLLCGCKYYRVYKVHLQSIPALCTGVCPASTHVIQLMKDLPN